MAPRGLYSASWTELESGGQVVGWWSQCGPETSGLPWAPLLTRPAVPGAWPCWSVCGAASAPPLRIPLGWVWLGRHGGTGLGVSARVTQAGCRGLELVALFSPWPCRVHAAASGSRESPGCGPAGLAAPQTHTATGTAGTGACPACLSLSGAVSTSQGAPGDQGPCAPGAPSVRALEELEGDLAPQTQPESLRGTLPLPQLPNQEHLWATMCYYPNCQPRGPLKRLREEETIISYRWRSGG